MEFKTKVIIGGFITAVGFISATVGLWDRFFPPIPDNEILLLPISTPDISVKNSSTNTNYLKANNLVIDGKNLVVEENGLLLANKITMKNGGRISGSDFNVVATIIDNGKIDASFSKDMSGGNIFLAAAQINGTEIVSNGASGKNGSNGRNGTSGGAGSNGRNGKCKGFGGWRSAHAGGTGGNGSNGTDGENGQNGGNAGNVTVLASYTLTTNPETNGGTAGKGGKGGAAGLGGKGGRGGRGCTGLGGSQNSQPSGADGNDGTPGKDGQDGQPGNNKTPTVKLVNFEEVKKSVEEYGNDKNKFLSALRAIRPRNNANK